MFAPAGVTFVTVPFVAVKLPAPTVPTTASSNVTTKLIVSFVTNAVVRSLTTLTLGETVSRTQASLNAIPEKPAAFSTRTIRVLLPASVTPDRLKVL